MNMTSLYYAGPVIRTGSLSQTVTLVTVPFWKLFELRLIVCGTDCQCMVSRNLKKA
jgi:hypothetical protein